MNNKQHAPRKNRTLRAIAVICMGVIALWIVPNLVRSYAYPSGDELIRWRIQGGVDQWGEQRPSGDLTIPAKYVGGILPSLTQGVFDQVEQGFVHYDDMRYMPLSFTYPKFEVWPQDWNAREEAGEKGFIFGTLSSGFGLIGLRKLAEEDTNSSYVGDAYGLRKYKEVYGNDHMNDIYRFFHPTIPPCDVAIKCLASGVRCQYYVNVYQNGFLDFNFTLFTTEIPKWREHVDAFRAFAHSFVIATDPPAQLCPSLNSTSSNAH